MPKNANKKQIVSSDERHKLSSNEHINCCKQQIIAVEKKTNHYCLMNNETSKVVLLISGEMNAVCITVEDVRPFD